MKKLIPALAMLLIAAVMLGTSTYAWFSMNTTVTATGMSVTATTPVNLLISSTEAGTYSNTVAADETYTGKLYPASSADAMKFNAIMNSGNYIGTNGAGGAAENGTTKFQKTSGQSESGVVAMSGSNDGYWAVYDFWVKLSQAQTDAELVYLSDLNVAQTVVGDGNAKAGENTHYTDIKCTTPVAENTTLTSGTTYYVKGLTGAIRAALLLGDAATGTRLTTYANAQATASVNAVIATYAANDSVFNSATDTASATCTTSYAYNSSYDFEVNGDPVQITLVVWIEGQDAACVNANAGATVAVDFALSVHIPTP